MSPPRSSPLDLRGGAERSRHARSPAPVAARGLRARSRLPTVRKLRSPRESFPMRFPKARAHVRGLPRALPVVRVLREQHDRFPAAARTQSTVRTVCAHALSHRAARRFETHRTALVPPGYLLPPRRGVTGYGLRVPRARADPSGCAERQGPTGLHARREQSRDRFSGSSLTLHLHRGPIQARDVRVRTILRSRAAGATDSAPDEENRGGLAVPVEGWFAPSDTGFRAAASRTICR